MDEKLHVERFILTMIAARGNRLNIVAALDSAAGERRSISACAIMLRNTRTPAAGEVANPLHSLENGNRQHHRHHGERGRNSLRKHDTSRLR